MAKRKITVAVHNNLHNGGADGADMYVSLNGLLERMKGRKDQKFMVQELIRHYTMAKEAHLKGDKETVDQFFNLYTVK